MWLDSAVKIAQIFSYAVTAGSAVVAAQVYRSSARRERARWAESLYSRFFEKSEPKKIRDILDTPPGNQEVAKLCDEGNKENIELTDYLNFFELVAYLQNERQLKPEDVDALFEYYLCCLKRHACVMQYINDEKKGFEHLKERLSGENLVCKE